MTFVKSCWAATKLRKDERVDTEERDEKGMYLVAWFFRFFRFSHFLALSITVVRIFVQIIALLFFIGRWQCGSHIALSPPWLPPLTGKLSCTIIHSVKRKKKLSRTIMSNLNMSKLHDSWR